MHYFSFHNWRMLALLPTLRQINLIWNKKKMQIYLRAFIQWFKLSGQNEQKLNFQTRFSRIGLRLDKKWSEQKLLRISSELIWCNFFFEILNQNCTPKLSHFGFFQLIKNYAETTLWINQKIISQEASYAAQKSLRRVKSPKNGADCLIFFLKPRFWVLYSKNFNDYQMKIFSLLLVFEDFTLLKHCWAA